MKTHYILIVLIICALAYRYNQIENWSPYKSCPFGNVDTVPRNQIFYLQPRYRKPLYHPYTFESSYPLKHKRHYEQKY